MRRCKYCNNWIEWIDKAPVTGQEVNILPVRGGELVGITANGMIILGHEVGDQCEDGYHICRIKHECGGKRNET